MHHTRLIMLQRLGALAFADAPGDGQGGTPASNDSAGSQAPADGENGQQGGQEGGDDPADWQMDDLPKGAREYIRGLRAEAKKDRTHQQQSAKDQENERLRTELGRVLGFVDDKPSEAQLQDTIARLTKERDDAQAVASEFTRDRAVRAAAAAAKIDADQALALKATDQALADIDFDDHRAVQDALLAVAEKHPHIKAASTVDQTGGDFQQGSGRQPSDPKTLQDALQGLYR